VSVSRLYQRIAGVTTRFEFTAPVEDLDLDAFRLHLVEAVLDFEQVEVRVERDPDPRYVLVEIGSAVGGYRRQMIIKK
jgi:hypothetical protein